MFKCIEKFINLEKHKITYILERSEYSISARNFTASTRGKELRYIACVDLPLNILP